MKKLLKNLHSLLLVVCVLMSAVFSSCDSDDEPDTTNTSGVIEGKWELTNYDKYPSFYIIDFKANGNASIIYEPGETADPHNAWKWKNDKLYIYFDTNYNYDDYLTGTVEFKDGMMYYTCDYEEEGTIFILKQID